MKEPFYSSSSSTQQKYKHVFLDLDDTIWDFQANAKSALQKVYEHQKLYSFFESFDQYFSLYSKRNLILWDLYSKGLISKDELSIDRFLYPLSHVGIHDPELALLIGKEYIELLPSCNQLLPSAREVLDYLHAKYTLTIVSNGFIELQYKKLENANIGHYFSHIVLSEHAKALKPDKRIFEYALALNNASANETIMIGDSYDADIAGAMNAGIDQIFLSLSAENNISKPASFTICKLQEITAIL